MSAQIVSKDTAVIKDTTKLFRVHDTLYIIQSLNAVRIKAEQKTDTIVRWKTCQHKELEIVKEETKKSRFPLVFVGLLVGFFLFLLFFLKK